MAPRFGPNGWCPRFANGARITVGWPPSPPRPRSSTTPARASSTRSSPGRGAPPPLTPRSSSRPSSRWDPRTSPPPGAGATRSSCSRGSRSTPTRRGRPVKDRPFPLDLVPRIIPAEEWTHDQARPRAAHPRAQPLRRRRLPRARDHPRGHRAVAAGRLAPRTSRAPCTASARRAASTCHVAGCDLVRDADGTWKVLEDNVRTPSGISYVLENRRRDDAAACPSCSPHYRVRPVDHYPQLLLAALRAVAPTAPTARRPSSCGRRARSTPPTSSTPSSRARWASSSSRRRDLVVRDDVLYMRTTDGLERVHAIYRRIDDDFVDPLEFRPDSLLGVPGLVRAYRAGHGRDRQRVRHRASPTTRRSTTTCRR